jgi:hypothetical protein
MHFKGEGMSLDVTSIKSIPLSVRTQRVTDPEVIANSRKNGTGGLFPRPFYDNGDDDFAIMASATHALIFLTMSIGMGAITKKNWTEFYARVRAEEKLHGARRSQKLVDGKWVDCPITAQDVKDHIGLSTNVSRMTEAQWRKSLLERFVREAKRDALLLTGGEEEEA